MPSAWKSPPRFSTWMMTWRAATGDRLKRCATAWKPPWPPVRAKPSAWSTRKRRSDALRFRVPGKGIELMTDLAHVDYFTDADVAQDPYDYWDYLRNEGPVFREPH